MIQSLQRGVVTLDSDNTTTDVTISAVTLSRAWLICTVRSADAGPTGYQLAYFLSSTTNIQMRVNTMTTANVVVEWQVCEFTAASGITVQRGTWTTQTSITISALSSVNQAHVQANLYIAGGALGADDWIRPKITGTTTLTTNDGQTNIKYYEIVDWGNKANVQHVDISVATTDTGTKDTTISTLTDYTKTIVIGHSEFGAGFVDTDFGNLYCTSNTNLRHVRSGGARACTITAQVIEFLDSNISVQQFNTNTIDTVSTTLNVTLSSVDTSKTVLIPQSSLYWWARSNLGNDIAGHFSLTYKLTNSTTATLQKASTGQTTIASFSTVEFTTATSGATSGTGSFNLHKITSTTSGTVIKPSAVVTDVSSDKTNGTYTTDDEIYISVEFDKAVYVSGTPQLNLAVKSGGYLVNYVEPKDPLDVVSLQVWYDASDISSITQSGGFASQWNDKSGNGRHLVQNTEGKKPSYGVRYINGLHALEFHLAGVDMMATSATFTAINSSAYSIFAIVIYDTVPGYFVGTNQETSGAGLHTGYRSSTQYTLDHYFYGVDYTVTPISGTPTIFNTQFDNVGSNIRINGTSIGNSGGFPNQALNVSSGVLNVGSGYNDNTNTLDGAIGELLIYAGALAQSDREQIEGILAHKWGISSVLDSGHPYKNRPPLVS